MSLDVYLTLEKPIVREMYPFEEETCEVFSANITHNLGKMADEAGLYEALWRPKEIDAEKAMSEKYITI